METKTEKIISKALGLLKTIPSGIRYSQLVKKIQEELPDIPVNTIHGIIWNLETRAPNEVYKPARGFFRHNMFKEMEVGKKEAEIPVMLDKKKEEDFYPLFADFLMTELEECTKAIPLGGSKFKDKWGTPDVIGILEPRKSDIIKPPTEVISAEIKIDTTNLITAFGQSCSYKLFSHRSYIVVPKDSSEEDIEKLDALCRIFGIGLILFNSNDTQLPEFDIRVRAAKHEPDMFYLNKNLKLIEDDLFK